MGREGQDCGRLVLQQLTSCLGGSSFTSCRGGGGDQQFSPLAGEVPVADHLWSVSCEHGEGGVRVCTL